MADQSRRKLIRKAVVDILKGQTQAGENVFSNLASTTEKDDLPAINVYTTGEVIEHLSKAPKQYKRTLTIVIEIISEGAETPDNAEIYLEDQLDDIGEQIETLLGKNEFLGKFTDAAGKECDLIDTLDLENLDFQFEADGDKPTGALRLTYLAQYTEFRPMSSDEQDVIHDFKTAVVSWNVGHDNAAPDGSVEAQDNIQIPNS